MKDTLDKPMATPLEEAKSVLAKAQNDDVIIRHSQDGTYIIEVHPHQRSQPAAKNKWVSIAEEMGERDIFQGRGDEVLKEIKDMRENFSLRSPVAN